jgi:hypothetical protein
LREQASIDSLTPDHFDKTFNLNALPVLTATNEYDRATWPRADDYVARLADLPDQVTRTLRRSSAILQRGWD